MPITTRQLNHTVYDQQGNLLENAFVVLTLIDVGVVSDGLVFPNPETKITDANGQVSFSVWANLSARYKISTFSQVLLENFTFLVPEGTAPIDTGVLISSEVIQGDQAAIQVIQDYVDQQIDQVQVTAGDNNLESFTASQSLSAHRVLILDSGLLAYASNDEPAKANQILGVSTNAGTDLIVRTRGLLSEASWSWAVGPIFLGTNGLITQTVDSMADFILQIGNAVSATQINIDIQQPIFRS